MQNRKIVLIGTFTEKQQFAAQLKNKDSFSETKSTIGLDFFSVSHQDITFQVWDTAGQERFRAAQSSSFLRGATAIVLINATPEQKEMVSRNKGTAFIIEYDPSTTPLECLDQIFYHLFPKKKEQKEEKEEKEEKEKKAIPRDQDQTPSAVTFKNNFL